MNNLARRLDELEELWSRFDLSSLILGELYTRTCQQKARVQLWFIPSPLPKPSTSSTRDGITHLSPVPLPPPSPTSSFPPRSPHPTSASPPRTLLLFVSSSPPPFLSRFPFQFRFRCSSFLWSCDEDGRRRRDRCCCRSRNRRRKGGRMFGRIWCR